MTAGELWIGLAEVRATEECDLEELEGVAGGFVTAFAFAETLEEFETAVESELDLHGVEVLSIQDAEPLHERLEWPPVLLELALQAARSGEVTLHVYAYEEGEDDEDVAVLREADGADEPVEFRIVASDARLFGFVVGMGDEWAVVHVVDPDLTVLDGYVAVRLEDVVDARIVSDDDFFARRALRMRNEEPVAPDIPLDDPQSILASVSDRFPVVSLEERRQSGLKAVGRIERLEEEAVVLRGITPAGRWADTYRHDYDEIVRIDFGRAYEQTLAWLTAFEEPGEVSEDSSDSPGAV